jgi:hypothetical protein
MSGPPDELFCVAAGDGAESKDALESKDHSGKLRFRPNDRENSLRSEAAKPNHEHGEMDERTSW